MLCIGCTVYHGKKTTLAQYHLPILPQSTGRMAFVPPHWWRQIQEEGWSERSPARPRIRCLRGEAASASFCKRQNGAMVAMRDPGTMQSMVAHGARLGQPQLLRSLAPYPRASPDSWQNSTRRRPRRTLTGMTKARLGPQGS